MLNAVGRGTQDGSLPRVFSLMEESLRHKKKNPKIPLMSGIKTPLFWGRWGLGLGAACCTGGAEEAAEICMSAAQRQREAPGPKETLALVGSEPRQVLQDQVSPETPHGGNTNPTHHPGRSHKEPVAPLTRLVTSVSPFPALSLSFLICELGAIPPWVNSKTERRCR